MIDRSKESVMPLARAARGLEIVRGDKPPCPQTLVRWADVGLKTASGRRVKLETVYVGGTRMTSEAALQRFFDRLNDVEYIPVPESAERERQRLEQQSEEAMQRMRATGMIRA